MTPMRSDRGFALSEFLVASVITLAVIGIAIKTFDDALKINDATLKLTDAGQNMRSGVNLLVRDLLQAGRDIPTGGIPLPNGAGAALVQRPSPSSFSYAFDNTTLTTLGAVTTGNLLGSTVAGRQTDMVTVLMGDPFLPISDVPSPYTTPTTAGFVVKPSTAAGAGPKLASDGSSLSMGNQGAWFAGNLADGVGPIKAGDILLFRSQIGSAMQVGHGGVERHGDLRLWRPLQPQPAQRRQRQHHRPPRQRHVGAAHPDDQLLRRGNHARRAAPHARPQHAPGAGPGRRRRGPAVHLRPGGRLDQPVECRRRAVHGRQRHLHRPARSARST